jgi:hypothetical protein
MGGAKKMILAVGGPFGNFRDRFDMKVYLYPMFFLEKRVYAFPNDDSSMLISPMFERHSEGEWQIPDLSNRLGKFRDHGLLMVASFLLSL